MKPTMRYRLRTLLIVLALGPPVLAGLWLVDWPEPGWIILATVVYLAGAFALIARQTKLL